MFRPCLSLPLHICMLAALVLTLLAPPAAAGRIATRLRDLGPAPFPRVQAAVHVFSREPLAPLTRDDFAVTEDGVRVDEFDVVVDDRPVYVTLVLDRSGSMRGSMEALKKAALGFLSSLDARVHCQLLSFSDSVRRETPFTPDLDEVERRVVTLRPYGATALYDAMGTALQNLASYPDGLRRSVLVFTDGRDGKAGSTRRLSRLSPRDVVQKARAEGIPVFCVGLGQEIDKRTLAKLAAYSGGRAVFSRSADRLAEMFRTVGRSMETGYRLRYRTPNPERDGSVRTVQVTSRALGTRDQGKGKYRAPADAGRDPYELDLERGETEYARMTRALYDLGSYAVRVDTETSGGLRLGEIQVPVRSRLDIVTDASDRTRVRQRVDTSLRVGEKDMDLTVVRGGGDALLTVEREGGARLARRIDLATADPEARALADPVGRLVPALSLDRRGEGRLEGLLEGMMGTGMVLFEEPDVLRIVGEDGYTAVGELVLDMETHLPLSLVTVDGRTGATSRARFLDWRTEGDFRIEAPETTGVTRGAEHAVDDAAATALDVVGHSLRAARLGELAAARAAEAAARAGEAGARAGLEGAAAGVRAAALAVRASRIAELGAHHALGRLAGPDPAALERSGKRLGGWAAALEDPALKVASEGSDEAYWQGFQRELDAGLAARSARFEQAMQAYHQGVERFVGEVMADHDRAMENFEETMERFGEDMGRFGEDMGRMGAELGEMGAELGRAGAAAGLAAGAAGAYAGEAGYAGGEAGQAAGAATRDALDAQADAIDGYGEAMDAQGQAMDAYGEAMDAAGAALDGLDW